MFREATIHGSLPWVADYTRRSLMFSYVPMHMALAPQGYSVVMEPCEHHTKSHCCWAPVLYKLQLLFWWCVQKSESRLGQGSRS